MTSLRSTRSRISAGTLAVATVVVGLTFVVPLAGADDPTTTVEPTTAVPTTAVPTTEVPPAPTTAVAPPAPAPPTAPTALPLSGPVLKSGSEGIEVAFLQFTLYQRGFWLADRLGRFGESTRHALVAFQKFYGLPRTGRLDPFSRLAVAGFSDRATPRGPGAGRRIEVDLRRQVMIISTGDRVEFVFDSASGKASTPTPRGSWKLTRQIRGVRRAPLGTLFSPKYFTGGYAIHGSNSVPAQPASHGCIRTTNQTIDYLWASNLIPLGTPITIS